MSHIHRSITLALVLGVAGSVQAAENPAPAPSAAPAPSQAPTAAAQIDPQALKTYRQMVTAYKALKSYSATIEMSEASGTTVTPLLSSTVSFRKPGMVSIRSTAAGNSMKVVADGKNLFSDIQGDAKHYLKQPLSGDPVQKTFQGSGLARTMLGTLVTNPDMIERSFTENPAISLRSLTLGAPGMMDGVPVDTISAQISIKQAPIVETITVSMGHDDHLARQIIIEAKSTSPNGKLPGGSSGMTMTETHRNVKSDPNLAAALFTYAAPAGAKPLREMPAPAEQATYDQRLKVGALPFSFSHAGLDGKTVALTQYKGKVVLLDFWATWCGPCVGEMPNVIAAYKKYHAKGFEVVGVSLDQDKESLTSFIKENKMPWPQVYDGKYWNSEVAQLYKVQAIPFGLLIGRDGKIAAVEARGPDLAPAIEKALAQK